MKITNNIYLNYITIKKLKINNNIYFINYKYK